MNYAATLAVMAVLAFGFPLLVKLGTELGLPAVYASALLWSLVVFCVTVWTVRWQVARHSQRVTLLTAARAQVAAQPQNPEAYFLEGRHLASRLLDVGRPREAAEVIDRYSRLGGARESDIVALRVELSSRQKWRFRKVRI
ncbi:hypothetical protein ACFP81_00365 [Deinococcus lacus]|uniref:Tetratricopeptide repeat protein n=1 Tax=Deinococcus lacus TaxID=392561 RepID=A0ABW1Y8J0_9DEIO